MILCIESHFISLQVEGPHNTKVYNSKRKSEEQFSFRAMYGGDYKFCASNVDHMAVTMELHYAIGHHHSTKAEVKGGEHAKEGAGVTRRD